jgi:hypothetical protein
MMRTLDLRRDSTLDTGTRDELTRIADGLLRQWPQLPAPIVLPCSEHPIVAVDGDSPWVWALATADPQRGPNGIAVVPRGQRRQLRHIAAAGSRFDAVAVAHELDVDGPVRSLLPELRNGPRTCTDEVARALVGPVPPHPGVTRAAGLLDGLFGGDALAWAGNALDLLLDPIVFGVVAPYGLADGAPGVYQPLVAWRW